VGVSGSADVLSQLNASCQYNRQLVCAQPLENDECDSAVLDARDVSVMVAMSHAAVDALDGALHS
jgi:hypothetical protein